MIKINRSNQIVNSFISEGYTLVFSALDGNFIKLRHMKNGNIITIYYENNGFSFYKNGKFIKSEQL